MNPGHGRQEKEDGNPNYSAFSTEQEPASLASKKDGWHWDHTHYGRVENMRDSPYNWL